MDKGYLILAQNTDNIDYIKQAYALSVSIKTTQSQYSDVAIIVDKKENIRKKHRWVFDHIIELDDDLAKTSQWKVENRWKHFNLTPFDETIVLDSDMIFTQDISSWWAALHHRSVHLTNKVKTFRGTDANDSYYRQVWIDNDLPNLYTAFMYFKKDKIAEEYFDMVRNVFLQWQKYYGHFLKKPQQFLSADMSYSIAAKILGQENYTCDNLSTFTHMKGYIQDISPQNITEDWTQHFTTNVTTSGNLYINNYLQSFPFHYFVKSWLTDDIINILENRYDRL